MVPWGNSYMLWFLSGYILAAAAFYTYITATAVEEPEPLSAYGEGTNPRRRTAVRHDDRINRKAA